MSRGEHVCRYTAKRVFKGPAHQQNVPKYTVVPPTTTKRRNAAHLNIVQPLRSVVVGIKGRPLLPKVRRRFKLIRRALIGGVGPSRDVVHRGHQRRFVVGRPSGIGGSVQGGVRSSSFLGSKGGGECSGEARGGLGVGRRGAAAVGCWLLLCLLFRGGGGRGFGGWVSYVDCRRMVDWLPLPTPSPQQPTPAEPQPSMQTQDSARPTSEAGYPLSLFVPPSLPLVLVARLMVELGGQV